MTSVHTQYTLFTAYLERCITIMTYIECHHVSHYFGLCFCTLFFAFACLFRKYVTISQFAGIVKECKTKLCD